MDALQILLVDDDEDDYVLTREILLQAPQIPFHLTWVASYSDALTEISTSRYDALLVDYDLGGKNGIDLIHEARQRHCSAAMILYSGHLWDQRLPELMQAEEIDLINKVEVTGALLEERILEAIRKCGDQGRVQ